jgi:cell division protein ZapA
MARSAKDKPDTSVNKVDVVIDGQKITLVSNEPAEYMLRLALYIDRKINELKNARPDIPVNEPTQMMLLAVNFADDYHKALAEARRLKELNEKYERDLTRIAEENALLNERFHDLQGELNNARRELSENVANIEDHPKFNKPRASGGFR